MIIADQIKSNKKGSIEWIDHKGKKIFLENFKDCDAQEISSLLDLCRKIIRTQSQGVLLELIDITNSKFNMEVAEDMKEFAKGNKLFSKKCAIVGVEGMKRIVIQNVSLFSGRKFETFNDLESAKEWLVKDE